MSKANLQTLTALPGSSSKSITVKELAHLFGHTKALADQVLDSNGINKKAKNAARLSKKYIKESEATAASGDVVLAMASAMQVVRYETQLQKALGWEL